MIYPFYPFFVYVLDFGRADIVTQCYTLCAELCFKTFVYIKSCAVVSICTACLVYIVCRCCTSSMYVPWQIDVAPLCFVFIFIRCTKDTHNGPYEKHEKNL